MKVLDLHGVRYAQVERLVENFVLLEDLPVKIITGNSSGMRAVVWKVLECYQINWQYESFYNLGAIIVSDWRV